MTSGSHRRGFSAAGFLLMAVGLALVIFELRTGLLRHRFGVAGYVLIMACGTSCSIWGLKEVMSYYLPRLAGRGYYFRLLREGVMFLLLTAFFFGGAMLGHSNLLLMVFTVMASAFLMNGWFTFTMLRGSRVARQIPERAMAGEPIAITVRLENRNPWLSSRLMTVHDTVLHDGEELEPEILFIQVPPGKKAIGVYHLQPLSRGRYQFSQVDLTTRFPLGLVQRGVGFDLPQQLLVYPRLGHLRPDFRRMRPSADELSSQIRGSSGAFQDELHQLREYRPGDDRRLIHWRTSARLDTLMVSEYQETRDRDLLLIVDAWLPPAASALQQEDLERGLQFALTIAMQALHSSRTSALYVSLLGKTAVHWNGDVERQPDALLDEFALLEPAQASGLSDLASLLQEESNRSRRLLVVTTRPGAVRQLLADWSDGLPPDVEVFGTTRSDLQAVFAESLTDRGPGVAAAGRSSRFPADSGAVESPANPAGVLSH